MIILADAEKCKKHWKNVRDRFVKVMHLRNKHFLQNGTEIDAPNYVYYEKLQFMEDFSIKKFPTPVETTPRTQQSTSSSRNFSPDLLIFEQIQDSKGNIEVFDLTLEFIEAVKEYECLYDENAELRKFRSDVAWKAIENKFGGKFSVGKLRSYWIQLFRKYKYYLSNYDALNGNINNEHIFEKLDFMPMTTYSKQEIMIISEDQSLLEDDEVDYEEVQETETETETEFVIENIEEVEEPSKKKLKTSIKDNCSTPITTSSNSFINESSNFNLPIPSTHQQAVKSEDEYDLFGKKVAIQLRDLSLKNKNLARKGEIKVLQILMELEDNI